MNKTNAILASALASLSLLVLGGAARAQEAQLGLGLVRSAESTQFQADIDVFRHFGFQLATGQSSRYGDFSGTAGGRFYLLGGRASPYAGVLYNVQSIHSSVSGDPRVTQAQYAGPTVGFRLKGNRGPGVFVEAEYLTPTAGSNEPPRTAVGAGVQWWF